MESLIARKLPIKQLQKLEFLIGEFEGVETLYPPESAPVQFLAHFVGSWEACERFVRIDFYGEVPGYGVETFNVMLSYAESIGKYRMWIFAASQEDPMYLVGDFEGSRLVMVSDASKMVWGIERLRFTLGPQEDGGTEILGERWEPDGFAKYCTAIVRPNHNLDFGK